MALPLPVLSLPDPPQSAEGSIDPLGLQATYERLAETIYPFITARMYRPRFLTAIALEAVVCDAWKDELAADRVTPAWLVCEWLLVEGFYRAWKVAGTGDRRSIPGIQKVGRVVDARRPVSAAAYLKTPRVFGLTGVYKTLAFGLRIVTDDIALDDGGFELIRVWEQEQGLDGFLDGRTGPGAKFREHLRSAVERGLRKGHSDVPSGWPVWEQIVRHLDPGNAGAREKSWIHRRLLDPELRLNPRDLDATSMRRELLERISSDHVRIGIGPHADSRADEATFFRSLIGKDSGVSRSLRERLRIIDAYEGLSRVIEDAMALIRHLSTVSSTGVIGPTDFAADPLARALTDRVAPATHCLAEVIAWSPWEVAMQRALTHFADVADPTAFFERILEHHEDAQRAKPPDGKRPWLERLASDRIVVRAQYRIADRFEESDAYVRDYRSFSACSFLRDLGRLRG